MTEFPNVPDIWREKETLMPVNGPSGGTGGNSQDTDSDEGFLEPGTRVARVLLSFDDGHDAVEGIQFTHLRNNGSLLDLPHHGGFGGDQIFFDLARNEHIIKISGKYGRFVNSITIETDNPAHPPITVGGTGGEGKYTYEAPPGFEIVGFYGRSGSLVDAIGVVLRAK
jgi:Jacalin-like lectin domain